jgi:hypothetical protein
LLEPYSIGRCGTYMIWWLECKDRKVWTKSFHKVVAIHA